MLQPLDGPSQQTAITLTNTVVQEAKGGGNALAERKVVTIQALTGKIYVYFGAEGVTPNAATVAANGLVQYKNQKESYEASTSQKLWILSVTVASNSVIVAERA